MKKTLIQLLILASFSTYASATTYSNADITEATVIVSKTGTPITGIFVTKEQLATNGSLVTAEYTMEKGIKHGPYKETTITVTSEEGFLGETLEKTVVETGTYTHGQKTGTIVRKEKTQWSEITFVNNVQQGAFTQYEDEQRFSTGTSINGKIDGILSHYHTSSSGNILTARFTYDNGVRSGPFTLYTEAGVKYASGNYINGAINGKVTFFDKDGSSLLARITYNSGKIEKIICYEDINVSEEIFSDFVLDITDPDMAQNICNDTRVMHE